MGYWSDLVAVLRVHTLLAVQNHRSNIVFWFWSTCTFGTSERWQLEGSDAKRDQRLRSGS